MPAQYDAFARRLHFALDHAGFEKGRSRTGKLATEFNVSRETARKWLNGDAMPEMERLIALSTRMKVAFEWLTTGRGEIAAPSSNQLAEPAPPQYADPLEARLTHLLRLMTPEQRQAWLVLLEGRTQ